MVAYRDADFFGPGTGNFNDADLQWPTGTVAGDLVLLWGGTNNNTGSFTVRRPSGTDVTASWTECADGPQTVSTTFRGNAFIKVLDATDISDGGVILRNSSSGRLCAGIHVISAPGTVESFEAKLEPSNTPGMSWDAFDPAAVSLAVAAVAYNIAAGTPTTTPPSGYTERVDTFSTNGSGRRMGAWGASYDTISDANIAANSVSTNNNCHGATWLLVVAEVPAVVDKSGSDTGSGADASTLTVAATRTDTSTGSDAGSLAAQSFGTDVVDCEDFFDTLAVSATGTDVANATDATSSLDQGATPKSGTDAGTATDTGTASATISGTETASGSDASSLAASHARADAGTAADGASLAAQTPGSDTAAGMDAGAVIVAVTGSETATAVEASSLDAGATPKTGADGCTAVESALVEVVVTSADSSAAVDATANLTVLLAGTEQATAAELAQLAAEVAATELAAATDTGTAADDTTIRFGGAALLGPRATGALRPPAAGGRLTPTTARGELTLQPFNDESRDQLTFEASVGRDPAATTIELKVDGTWYAATWTDDAVQGVDDDGDPLWTRPAETNGMFAGSAHPDPDGAVVLNPGAHHTEGRVVWTSDGRTLAFDIEALYVQ